MTLATHAVAGALIGALLPHDPALAFALGFASHFAFDAIPHWDYKLATLSAEDGDALSMSIGSGRALVGDFFRTGGDVLVGILASLFLLLFLFPVPFAWAIPLAMAGAIFPDFLQFAYMKWRHEPLVSLQRFHGWIHAETKIQDARAGVLLQIAFVATLSAAFLFLR